MRIDELDEFQGVTPQLVTAWLLTNGWTQTQTEMVGARGGRLFVWLAAIYTDGNVQALLEKINPRMRKGMPSQAALRAHRGLWLRSLGKENVATVLSRQLEEFPSPRDAESFFWPCDENYNKTRWPTDANGVML